VNATAPVRLIATDLDGTLLRPDKTIGRRGLAALRGAADAGIHLVAATGRQPGGLPVDLPSCGFGHLLGANGAICIDQASGEIVFEELITAETVAAIASLLRRAMPEARLSAARDHGLHYAIEPGYQELITPSEKVPKGYLVAESAAAVISEPTLKLSVRHPELSAEAMLQALNQSGLTGFHATTSGAPFLEVGGDGVTKASGLIRLCALLNIDAEEVLAAGDAGNDVEMISWAGRGVAMGNASAQLKAIADQVTAPNTEDGLAIVIEAVLTERRTKWNRPSTAI
jgi:Cof subfamily protein (haloacid dehalogenase superfamily)